MRSFLWLGSLCSFGYAWINLARLRQAWLTKNVQYIENSRRGWILQSVVCKVLCFYLPLRGHRSPNPRGCIKHASTYPRPDEERVGDLYRSERSERPRYTKYP